MITRMFAGLLKRLEFWVFAFAMAILVPEVWAHWFEARFKPVITRLEITSIQADPEGSVLAGHARRLRNCNWVETRWWLGRRPEGDSHLQCPDRKVTLHPIADGPTNDTAGM